MSDKPTGVFVRLPLSEAQKQGMYDYVSGDASMEDAICAIGVPVTGGELTRTGTVAWFEKDREPSLASYCPALFKTGDSVPVTSMPIAQAQIAELEAEVVRLREYYEASEVIYEVGLINATPEMFRRRQLAQEALKGGAA